MLEAYVRERKMRELLMLSKILLKASLARVGSSRLTNCSSAGRWLFALPLLAATLAVVNVQPARAEMTGYVGVDLSSNYVELNNDDGDIPQVTTTIYVDHDTRKFDLSMFAETAELKSDDDKNTASIKSVGGRTATSRLGSGATVWRARLNLALFLPTKRSRRF